MRRMNSIIKGRAALLLLFALIYALWGTALYYSRCIEEDYRAVSIRIEEGTVEGRTLAYMAEQEMEGEKKGLKGITAWNRKERQLIEVGILSSGIVVYPQERKLSLIEVSGDMERAYPIYIAGGYIPAADDLQGCLIDEDTAYGLFGTMDAMGNSVSYDGESYLVRGILHTREAVCLIVRELEKMDYANLELTFAAESSGGQQAEELLRRYGISGSYTLIDGYLISRGLSLAALLPAWLMGFCLLYEVGAALWRRRSIPVQAVSLFLLLLCIWPLISWMMEFEVFFPQQLVPAKWSDFSFWSRRYADFLEWRRGMDYITPNYKDILLKQDIRNCLTCTAAAAVGIPALRIYRHLLPVNRQEAGSLLPAAVLECTVICLLFSFGRSFPLPRAYLGMPLFYMLAENCLRWGRGGYKAYRYHKWSCRIK